MSLDWSKPIRNRRGEPARLLGTISGTGFTHFVAVKRHVGDEVGYSVLASGDAAFAHSNSDLDIVNAPEIEVVYANVFHGGWSAKWRDSLTETRKYAAEASVGVVKITIEDGRAVRAEVV